MVVLRTLLLAALVLIPASLSAQQTAVFAVTGGYAEGADDPGALLRVDPDTGAVTVVGTPLPGRGLPGLAATPDGRLFAVTDRNDDDAGTLIRIDPHTGALAALIGDMEFMGQAISMNDIAIDPTTGVLYGSVAEGPPPAGDNALVTIDLTTAEVTYLGEPAYTGSSYAALAFTPDGTLWAKQSHNANYHTLNKATGAITSTQTTAPTVGALGLGALDADRLILSECCVTIGNNLYVLDIATGNATLLGAAGGTRRIHDFTVASVTLPADIPTADGYALLTLLGLLAVAGVLACRRLF